MAPSVCECLLGDPSSRSTTEWRWGRKGSFRLRLDSGTWNDFESGEGGGVLALVMREERCDKAAALEWLQQHGFLRPRVAYAPQTGNSAKFALSQSTNRATNQRRSTRPPEQERRDTLRWIRSQVLPIADAKDHPVRAWLARRNLWRPELPLPPSLRWIPADSPVFRRTHSGSGAIAFPLARGQAGFQRSRPPDTPHLSIGTTPPGERASRPHAVPSVIAQFPCDAAPGHTAGGNRMGPAEAEPWRRCRSIRVEEMGEAIPGFVRAGRPRSRGTFSHDVVTPTSQYCRSIRAPLVIEGAPSVFVPIRVHSWFVFISKTKTAGCFSSV